MAHLFARMFGSKNASEGRDDRNVIATASFLLTLPQSWVIDLSTQPTSARGPAGEVLEISSKAIQGTGSAEEEAQLRSEMTQLVARVLERAAAGPGLVTVQSLKRTENDGIVMHEMLSQTNQGAWFAQFGITGPATVLLLTLHTSLDATETIRAVRDAIVAIRWTGRGTPR
jgi:hypothetical protein